MSRAGPLLLLLLLPALSAQAEEVPPIAPADIDAAIVRGVDWLLEEQRGNGSWDNAPGPSVLAVFALLHAGAREHTPGRRGKRMKRAWAWLDRFGPGAKKKEKAETYASSLMLLALDVRGRDEDRPRMQRLTDQLVHGQATNGQWTYALKPGASVGDNSNTQFAVLALGVAWGADLRIPRTTLDRARAWWQTSPHKNGGFGYASGGSKASARKVSMTAAGISALAVLDSARSRTPPTAASLLVANPVLRRAYASLAEDFAISPKATKTQRKGKRVAGQSWPHYYLWTMERAMVLLGVREIKTIDWFDAGTRHLLKSQKKDGSWRGEKPLYATSFALLFLTRAADPPRVFTKSAPVTGEPKPRPKAADEASGTVAEWLQETLAPDELARRCRVRGPQTLRTLVRALDDADPKIRVRAMEALSQLLPASQLVGIDKHPLPRARLAWWLRRHSAALVVREGLFRLVE